MRFYSAHLNARGEFKIFSDGIEMLSNLIEPVRAEYKRLSQNQDYSSLATRESVVLCLGKCSWTLTMLIANYYSCVCEDAGGVRSLSSLLILQELMVKVTKIIKKGSSGNDRTMSHFQLGSQLCQLTSISPDFPRDSASAGLF